MKCESEGDRAVVTVSEDEIYTRFYIKLDSEPAGGTYELIRVVHLLAGATEIGRCYMESRPQGKCFRLHLKYPSAQDWIYWFDWKIDTWYCMEFGFKKAASGFGKLWINDNLVCDSGTINTSGSPTVDTVRIGVDWSSGGGDPFSNVYIDCVAIMDSGPIGTHTDFDNGFEEADFSAYNGVYGTPSLSASILHCGVYGLKNQISKTESEGVYVNLGHQKELFLQFEVRFPDTSLASGEKLIFASIKESTQSYDILKLFLTNEGGTIKWGYTYRNAGSETSATEDIIETNPASGTFFCIDVEIVMSSRDGDAEGSYKMYIDGALCDDIDMSSIDTDYTGVSFLELVTENSSASAIVYYDCVKWQNTDPGACHAAGYIEPIVYVAETDCVPELTNEEFQVFKNCSKLQIEDLTVSSGERGNAKLVIPYSYPIARGDLIHVFMQGTNILAGKAVSISRDRNAGTKTVHCQTKTARLYSRFVLSQGHRTYSGEDIGAIVKDLIDYYFNGTFTSNNVNENTGITVSDFDCFDKSVGAAIDDLMSRANATCYVDADNDVHLFVKGTESSNAVFDKNNIVDKIVVDEIGEPIGTLIVRGNSGEVTGVTGQGLPEFMHSDRRITSNEEAQEIAEALYNKYGESVTTKFSVLGFFDLKKGQNAILDMPLDGYENETVIIEDVSYTCNSGTFTTNITLGELPVSYEHLLLNIEQQIQEQKVNRISDHTGTNTGDADPALEYTEILDSTVTVQDRVQTAEVELDSQACSTESDAANVAVILVDLNRGSSGGSGYVRIELSGSVQGIIEQWLIYVDADLSQYLKRAVVFDDLSGETITVNAEGYGSTDVYLTCQIVVKQILKHAHDVTQALKHEFD